VPVWLHPADRPLYDGAADQGAWLGVRAPPPPPPPDRELAHGDTLALGSLTFEVRHVPGHSPGSVAFVGHGVAFVGDAVFAGSVGRVDLPGGDGATLLTSIREQLLTLPDETVLYAGHGPETSVGAERRANPFLTGAFPLA
jgi:glyoxylase-like metal-dependent hydrolase (beta-lactamase superfamily II)